MIKLELGCGVSPTPGYVHHDRVTHAPHVDLAWDLRDAPWPFVARDDKVVIPDYATTPVFVAVQEKTMTDEERTLLVDNIKSSIRDRPRHPSEWQSLPQGMEYKSVRRSADGGAFVDEILALDVFEHVSNDIAFWLDECWRLLVPGGLLDVRLPAWDHELSYRDPTHLRVFHKDVFYYWDPTHELHTNFGSIYFGDTAKWWEVIEVFDENNDLRFRLKKRGTTSVSPPA